MSEVGHVVNSGLAAAAASAFANSRLELTILPTERCQFRCSYCYEDFKVGRMRPPIVQGIKNLIAERAPQLSTLAISWFGGEPLLASDIVLDIMDFSKRTCSTDTTILGSMTTNGERLSITLLSSLLDVGVTDYQITLDGARHHHDRTRAYANGSGTFDPIWENLIAAKRSCLNFQIMIRLHVTPTNSTDIATFCDELVSTFLADGDERFRIFPMLVGDWGGPKTGRIETLPSDVGETLLAQLRDTLRSTKSDQIQKSTYVCYAAKPNAFMIRADGRIGKCTVALTSAANCIGHLNADGSMSLSQPKAAHWIQGWERLDADMLGCPLGEALRLSGLPPVDYQGA